MGNKKHKIIKSFVNYTAGSIGLLILISRPLLKMSHFLRWFKTKRNHIINLNAYIQATKCF